MNCKNAHGVGLSLCVFRLTALRRDDMTEPSGEANCIKHYILERATSALKLEAGP